MEPFPSFALAIDHLSDEVGTFTDPETSLVKEQDQEIITLSERRMNIDGTEKLTELAGVDIVPLAGRLNIETSKRK